MVARTPPKQRKVLAPLNPVLLRETVKKVDKCMARLQELQFTVTGGTKVISGVSLGPRSTRGCLRTSLRCKQETLRIKNATPKRSAGGKMPENARGEWRRMSLPAMLVGATVAEILQATEFARECVAAVATKTKKMTLEDPKTPVAQKRNNNLRPNLENTELRIRRRKQKQNKLQSIRSESDSPSSQRARLRINFKASPPEVREIEKENSRYLANGVSPRNKPWAKKDCTIPKSFVSFDTITAAEIFQDKVSGYCKKQATSAQVLDQVSAIGFQVSSEDQKPASGFPFTHKASKLEQEVSKIVNSFETTPIIFTFEIGQQIGVSIEEQKNRTEG